MQLLKETFFDAMRICLAIVVVAFLVLSVYQLVSSKSPYQLIRQLSTQTSPKPTEICNTQASLNLNGAPNAQLAKLATYQQACGSFVTGTMMTFVGIPTSDKNAVLEARQVAPTLRAFAAYHVRPLVIAEPSDYVDGTAVDMGQFASGSYTGYLATMFADLQTDHITDSQMGVWNPFPEANLPYWKNNQPSDFAPDVNTYVSTLHKYFPHTQTSIMLSAASYQPTDATLKNAQYVSLMPYLQGIAPHTIDYAGLEGFPWLAPHSEDGGLLDASTFLKPSLISEAADYLGTKNIWLNTGTFAAQYTQHPAQTVHLSSSQRRAILASIDNQAVLLQKQGYHVAVNMFAQDKSNTNEEINWSYWSNNTPLGSSTTPVLTNFIRTLYQQQISFWLFDQ